MNRNVSSITAIDYSNYNGKFARGNKFFELSNHLQNVLVTISDKKIGVDVAPADGIIDYYNADVVTASDYYPFGMTMPGRKYQQGSSTYRYGFNGQEKSDEIKGEGNSYTAEFWEYDPRIGRRWNLDPKPNLAISPYAAYENNPIRFSDVYGDSIIIGNIYEKNKNGTYKNPNNIFAFELFASSKDGQTYIKEHAQKGFKLKGVYITDLNIDINEEGAASKKGIDIRLNYGVENNPIALATTDHAIENKRLKVLINVDNLSNNISNSEHRNLLLQGVESWGHEAFTHGELHESRFLGKQVPCCDFNHNYDAISSVSYLKGVYYYGNNIGYDKQSVINILNSKAIRMLNEVQMKRIVLNVNEKVYTKKELFNKFIHGGLLWPSLK